MDKEKLIELVQRSLGIRHKLKVLESMKAPETHEEIAVSTLSRWELEDELAAIEEILETSRRGQVTEKRKMIESTLKSGGTVKQAAKSSRAKRKS